PHPQIAELLTTLSASMADVGDWRGALSVARRALDIYRTRAESDPLTYRPKLAQALNDHPVRLAEAGRRDEALRFSQEAVDLFWRLAVDNPVTYLSDLAAAANNHAVAMAEAGRSARSTEVQSRSRRSISAARGRRSRRLPSRSCQFVE